MKSTDPLSEEKGVEPSTAIFIEFDETMVIDTVNVNYTLTVNNGRKVAARLAPHPEITISVW